MSDKTEWMKLHGQMPDGGPVYSETNIHELIAEPWNAISSLAFLIPAIYWIWRCRRNLRGNIFLLTCCLLLSTGGLGSTLFHAFRKLPALLLMDILPIILLTVIVSIYFWIKILPKWWLVILIIIPAYLLRVWVAKHLTAHDGINMNYFISGTLIFLPLLILLIKTKFHQWSYILAALILLATGLFFRKIDSDTPPLLSMGTHWLWHLFCAGGAYYLGYFIYHRENTESTL
jgi:hypothetical protein